MELQTLTNTGFHVGDMRVDLGFFCNDGDVHIHQDRLVHRDMPSSFFQKNGTGSPLPTWIGVGEKLSNVRLAQGSKQGIAQRMQDDIRIRMPIESFGVFDPDTPQNQGPTLYETMDVITDAHAGFHDR